ncbi:beta-ketoacyl synthase domain-containing protein [Ophiocordyceps sinensis CO18]|uniref:Beta-ketoacyl synthase domain-containing protein n=1 Tax=Ophiocordyceps sinensis (strain Co18 / CGMCC 3.14243) TaxID=911162 RepID=T5AI16_OPHSC|nr:beta-ketoacyl synthase domain-containing protein [Ophiocordyceps sinensis CO18]
MEEGADKLWHGDVVILDGDRVVAFFGQIAIQGVPRRILKVILSIESGNKTQKQQPAPKQHPTKQHPTLPASVGAPKTESHASRLAQALQIIAEESGLAVGDLTDGTVFGDVDIDSLLGLTISARFKEELDMDLDFNALFYEYPTVGDLKAFLGASRSGTAVSSPKSSNTGSSTPLSAATPLSSGTAATTPTTDEFGAKVDFGRALAIVSEESGVAVEELTDDTNFADSGVDSLLSLVIVSRFRDELELDIQQESLFLECPTVADLKLLLLGGPSPVEPGPAPEVTPGTGPAPEVGRNAVKMDMDALAARKQAVDALVAKYTAGFSAPGVSPSAPMPSDDEKVVLVTGASGSLGGHLVYHLAQLPDVKTVVCLNRENRAEPKDRQLKAMRAKGIRFPEALQAKLVVLQTDSAKPLFGLPPAEYAGLAGSVTHLRRGGPTAVPERRVGIDTVLPNGYGDAKWGCERMLDETLHRHPHRLRTMAVRLGQIAGSKTSGYWNPMEHFGFLVKSSQTLNALPDVDGTIFWTPVNDIAATLSDLVLSERAPHPIYHIENPVGQSWRETNAILADALNIPNLIPFDEWVDRVRNAPQRNNPASTLLEFLDGNYLRMSCGGLVLDVKNTLEHSKTLSAVGPVSEEVIRKYIHVWKEIGFLN